MYVVLNLGPFVLYMYISLYIAAFTTLSFLEIVFMPVF